MYINYRSCLSKQQSTISDASTQTANFQPLVSQRCDTTSTSDASTQTANFQPLVSQRCDTSTQTYTPLQVSLKVPQSLHAVPLYDLSHAFASKCASYAIDVPNDFLPLCLQAITNLKENERSNLLYNLAKGLGTKKKDTNETLFPLNRMPLGLLEYTASFYISESINEVR